jgi:hypothetical protein
VNSPLRAVPLFVLSCALATAGPAPAQSYSPNSRLVRCESVNSREVRCRIPDGQAAELYKQESRADCVRGRTYFIEADYIIVTEGCRATFRLVDAPYGVGSDGLRSELRSRLAVELGRIIRDDHRFNSSPSIVVVSDRDHGEGDGRIAYEGTARVERSGAYWNTVEFDASYDLRTHAFTRIDYDIADTGGSDERMDADVEAALERALADEVRHQKGGGTVQVAINHRHHRTRGGGTVTYTGKFGYTWNDGDWVTRGFEAAVNPSGQQVRNVRIWKLDNR